MNTLKALSVGAVLVYGLAFANTASGQEPTHLIGDWRCTSQGSAWYFGLEPAGYEYELIIDEQMGPAFSGHYIWQWERTGNELEEEHIATQDHAIISDDGTTVTAREEVIGVIGPRPDTITMVEVDETMRFDGFIIDDNTIEYVHSRPGRYAAADLFTCERAAS